MSKKQKLESLDDIQNYMEYIEPYNTKIRIIGAGGAGNNTIQRLIRKGTKSIHTVIVNTDAQDLHENKADKKVLIGKNITGGLGAGGDPMLGERAAEESKDILSTVMEDSDMLFLTGGLGGGTGTGSLPVIGRIAKGKGILTVAIVTMPFSEEGIIRWENAQIGLEKLRKSVDTLIVLRNDKLLDLYPTLPLTEAFLNGDEMLINSLIGLSDLILNTGLINLDFADVNMVMRDGPNAVIGVGESDSENRCEDAVQRAVSHPMMEIDITGAQSALIHISCGTNMSVQETRKVIRLVAEKLDPGARIIWGTTLNKQLKNTLRIMLIVSGLIEKEHRKIREKRHVESTPYGTDQESTQKSDQPQKEYQDRTIFDIKDSILASGSEVSTQVKKPQQVTQTTMVFYKIFEDEATGDLERFDRALHFLRRNPGNRKALLDAQQACKLLYASAQMFGFDEIGQLLNAIDHIFTRIHSSELLLKDEILDSLTLGMEMVFDLIENRSDGRGETGYIVDRLKSLVTE